MSAARVRGELRMILAAEEPRMIGKLDHLAQIARARAFGPRTDPQAGGLEPRQIMIVDLVAMPVALGDRRRAVNPVRKRGRHDLAWLGAEPHRTPQIGRCGAWLRGFLTVLRFRDQ